MGTLTLNALTFNTVYPVGTPVLYWPGTRREPGIPSRTRSEAWDLGGCVPVVLVEGKAGCIALTHIEPSVQPAGGTQ